VVGLCSLSLSFFSELLFKKSKAVPGVFGVLVADPNEANAPEPSPNALLAPLVGDDTPAVESGGMLLNGLFEVDGRAPSWPPKPRFGRLLGWESLESLELPVLLLVRC
jgi:hypothetical protein